MKFNSIHRSRNVERSELLDCKGEEISLHKLINDREGNDKKIEEGHSISDFDGNEYTNVVNNANILVYHLSLSEFTDNPAIKLDSSSFKNYMVLCQIELAKSCL